MKVTGKHEKFNWTRKKVLWYIMTIRCPKPAKLILFQLSLSESKKRNKCQDKAWGECDPTNTNFDMTICTLNTDIFIRIPHFKIPKKNKDIFAEPSNHKLRGKYKEDYVYFWTSSWLERSNYINFMWLKHTCTSAYKLFVCDSFIDRV